LNATRMYGINGWPWKTAQNRSLNEAGRKKGRPPETGVALNKQGNIK